jgi:hypothetical protein
MGWVLGKEEQVKVPLRSRRGRFQFCVLTFFSFLPIAVVDKRDSLRPARSVAVAIHYSIGLAERYGTPWHRVNLYPEFALPARFADLLSIYANVRDHLH